MTGLMGGFLALTTAAMMATPLGIGIVAVALVTISIASISYYLTNKSFKYNRNTSSVMQTVIKKIKNATGRLELLNSERHNFTDGNVGELEELADHNRVNQLKDSLKKIVA